MRPAFDQISGALEDLNEERQRPTGRLRIWAAPLAPAIVVAPIWQRYLSTYPEVQLEIWTELGPVDLVASGFDAIIGPNRWAAPNMIKVRLTGPIEVAVVAAPMYFAGRRPPRTPEDLASHSAIQYRFGAKGPVAKWDFERNGKEQHIAVPGRVTVNTIELALRAALDGLGIARVHAELAAPFLRTGQLTRILRIGRQRWKAIFFLSWTSAGSRALRAFIEMVRAHIRHGHVRPRKLFSSRVEFLIDSPFIPSAGRAPRIAEFASTVNAAEINSYSESCQHIPRIEPWACLHTLCGSGRM